MNDLTIQDLKQIEEYAYNLMSWKDIPYLMNIPLAVFHEWFKNPSSEVHIAYQKGRVRRKLELREPILRMALHGSPQAEVLSIKFLEEQFLDESDD